MPANNSIEDAKRLRSRLRWMRTVPLLSHSELEPIWNVLEEALKKIADGETQGMPLPLIEEMVRGLAILTARIEAPNAHQWRKFGQDHLHGALTIALTTFAQIAALPSLEAPRERVSVGTMGLAKITRDNLTYKMLINPMLGGDLARPRLQKLKHALEQMALGNAAKVPATCQEDIGFIQAYIARRLEDPSSGMEPESSRRARVDFLKEAADYLAQLKVKILLHFMDNPPREERGKGS